MAIRTRKSIKAGISLNFPKDTELFWQATVAFFNVSRNSYSVWNPLSFPQRLTQGDKVILSQFQWSQVIKTRNEQKKRAYENA